MVRRRWRWVTVQASFYWRKTSMATFLRPLQNLGRMALTVYLSGTVMFTTLFYGWGFGQLFLLGPAATTAYAVLFFILNCFSAPGG